MSLKSVQNVFFDLSSGISGGAKSVTITAVDTANSLIVPGGFALDSNTSVAQFCKFSFASSTSLTCALFSTFSNGSNFDAYAIVLEFYPGTIKSIQTGTCHLTGAGATGTATVTAVGAKHCIIPQGATYASGRTDLPGAGQCTLTLSGTTLTATRNTTGGSGDGDDVTVGFMLVEFW